MKANHSELPVLGISLSDIALTKLLIENPAGAYSALRDIVEMTGTGLLYVGEDRFLHETDRGLAPSGLSSGKYLDPLFAAQELLFRLPQAVALVSVSPEVEHPYNYARRVSTADHFTAGRLGVVVGIRDRRAQNLNQAQTSWTDFPTSPELTADFVTVLRRLWSSWPRESIIADKERGIFAEVSQIAQIDHEGFYRVAGPLSSPSSVQGEPPVGWHITLGSSELRRAGDAEFFISSSNAEMHPPEGTNGRTSSPGVGIAVLRWSYFQHELVNATKAGAFNGAVIRVTHLDQLAKVAHFLTNTPADRTSTEGTLRQRLNLAPRRYDVSEFQPAFGKKATVGGVGS